MKTKIILTTFKDCQKFSNICESFSEVIEIFSPKQNFRGNGKSLIGCLASLEWNDLWVEYPEEIEDVFSSKIQEFLISEKDGNYIHEEL